MVRSPTSDNTHCSLLHLIGYVMSGSVAGMLYQASHSVPALHLEDAYITGILRTKFNELSKAREDNPPVSLQVKDDLKFSLVKR